MVRSLSQRIPLLVRRGGRSHIMSKTHFPTAQTARAAAPIDLTGYWVALVTNEWRWRMVTPPKGDYATLPINAEARRIADTWDPARDEAAGNECRSYGAAIIMQVPGR